mmetsp:Transcript_94077/g.251887  ORF Transcript_94077/g.251887 Transcript_94077/m.251887 type:complete len:347 (+) Transcript_94077:358-1398(+)
MTWPQTALQATYHPPQQDLWVELEVQTSQLSLRTPLRPGPCQVLPSAMPFRQTCSCLQQEPPLKTSHCPPLHASLHAPRLCVFAAHADVPRPASSAVRLAFSPHPCGDPLLGGGPHGDHVRAEHRLGDPNLCEDLHAGHGPGGRRDPFCPRDGRRGDHRPDGHRVSSRLGDAHPLACHRPCGRSRVDPTHGGPHVGPRHDGRHLDGHCPGAPRLSAHCHALLPQCVPFPVFLVTTRGDQMLVRWLRALRCRQLQGWVVHWWLRHAAARHWEIAYCWRRCWLAETPVSRPYLPFAPARHPCVGGHLRTACWLRLSASCRQCVHCSNAPARRWYYQAKASSLGQDLAR